MPSTRPPRHWFARASKPPAPRPLCTLREAPLRRNKPVRKRNVNSERAKRSFLCRSRSLHRFSSAPCWNSKNAAESGLGSREIGGKPPPNRAIPVQNREQRMYAGRSCIRCQRIAQPNNPPRNSRRRNESRGRVHRHTPEKDTSPPERAIPQPERLRHGAVGHVARRAC